LREGTRRFATCRGGSKGTTYTGLLIMLALEERRSGQLRTCPSRLRLMTGYKALGILRASSRRNFGLKASARSPVLAQN
jgi:hypothetical protein